MLKKVIFIIGGGIEGGVSDAVLAEAARAVRMLKAEGFDSGIVTGENIPIPRRSENRPADAEGNVRMLKAEESDSGIVTGENILNLQQSENRPPDAAGRDVFFALGGNPFLQRAEEPENTLFLCDSGKIIRALQKEGFCAAGYSHAGNAAEKFSGVSFIIQEPDQVDADSYIKIYEREAGLPWTILRTPRCLVREFTVDDLDAIYTLYDDRARQYLEAPSEDRAHEREILKAYIERIYGLYGFGHWAVFAADREISREEKSIPEESGRSLTPLPVEAGTLIGRIGFAAVTAEREAEAAALGIRGIDADFGFLVAASCRGTGAAEEVCAALLRYGFEMLGFLRVSADAHIGNRASIRLLKKLGFTPVGKSGDRIIFIRDAE